MSNELSKAIKKKTDAQFRTMGEDRSPSISEGAGGDVIIVDPGQYTIPYVAGKNIHIGTSGNSKVINALMNVLAGENISVTGPDENGAVTIKSSLGGKAIDLSGLADGYVLKYDLATDKFVLGEGGGISEVPQATATALGGVKAKPRTTEAAEVAIDTASGKLYAPASSGGGTGGITESIELTAPSNEIVLAVPLTDKFEVVLFYPAVPDTKCNPAFRFNGDDTNSYAEHRWSQKGSSGNGTATSILSLLASSNTTAGQQLMIKLNVSQLNGRAFVDGKVGHTDAVGMFAGTWKKGTGEPITSVNITSQFGSPTFPVGTMAFVVV